MTTTGRALADSTAIQGFSDEASAPRARLVEFISRYANISFWLSGK
jgi:hypothetical protein